METIVGRIRREKEDFRTKTIETSSGQRYSQYRTLQRVELYLNSKFETGEFDAQGFKKFFYNVIIRPCEIATKEIDLDTKDIIVRAEDGDHLTADFMSKELRQWLKDEGMAAKLNQFADEGPRYGSVVVKTVNGEIYSVDVVNGFVLTNPAADNLRQTDTIEIHSYSYDEIQRQGWDKKKVQEAIDLYQKLEKPIVTVDERYGWVKESELKPGGSPEKYVYTLAIVAGAEEVETSTDKTKVIEKGVVLFHEEIDPDDFPYREWHFGRKVKNRWLRVGFAEALFDAQIARNESKYYNRKGLRWTSLHLWQTDDGTVAANLLTDKNDGDVIKTQNGRTISPLAMEERNLAHYQTEDRDWDNLVQDLTFSGDVLAGESLPSGTTARAAVLSNDNAKRFFDRKREDYGIFLRELILNDILPTFQKISNKEHIFSFSGYGPERDRLEKMIFDLNISARYSQFVNENGRIPSAAEWLVIVGEEQTKLANQPALSVNFGANFYKNFKYRIDVVITRENEDTDAKIQGRQMVIQSLAANPGIVTNPMTRSSFLELAHLQGVNNLYVPQGVQNNQPLEPGAPTAAPVTPMV